MFDSYNVLNGAPLGASFTNCVVWEVIPVMKAPTERGPPVVSVPPVAPTRVCLCPIVLSGYTFLLNMGPNNGVLLTKRPCGQTVCKPQRTRNPLKGPMLPKKCGTQGGVTVPNWCLSLWPEGPPKTVSVPYSLGAVITTGGFTTYVAPKKAFGPKLLGLV